MGDVVAHGLKRRLEDLLADDEAALADLDAVLEAARELPYAGKTACRPFSHLALVRHFHESARRTL